MPNASIFAHLGLFVRRGFLSAQSCRTIRAEMASGARAAAMVRPVGQADGVVDQESRRTGVVQMPSSTIALVRERLLALRPELEAYFRVQLGGCQRLQFYIYEEGDFFVIHQDRNDSDPLAPDWLRSRRVSASILLNDETGGLDGQVYRGGSLVFYGRRGDRDGSIHGIPLESEEGMFVAFPSDWFHEVRPITSGRRYSIVTWFV
jgi:predicted 2-oxoglutarate/Fe(II)-dependent dioxygenase YbiX